MPYLVKVDQANLAPGTPVMISHLGTIKNGSAAEVSDEDVATFEAVTGWKFVEAVEAMYGVSIEKPEEVEVPKASSKKSSVSPRQSEGGK